MNLVSDSASAVAGYLVRNRQAERHWGDDGHAPGNDVVRLRSVKVCSSDGTVANIVTLDRPVIVEVEYETFSAPLAKYSDLRRATDAANLVNQLAKVRRSIESN